MRLLSEELLNGDSGLAISQIVKVMRGTTMKKSCIGSSAETIVKVDNHQHTILIKEDHKSTIRLNEEYPEGWIL